MTSGVCEGNVSNINLNIEQMVYWYLRNNVDEVEPY